MTVQSKIKNWKVRVRASDCKIIIEKDGVSTNWEIGLRKYKDNGMRAFPKELYELIKKDIKYANIYDRFLEKFWNWVEKEEE